MTKAYKISVLMLIPAIFAVSVFLLKNEYLKNIKPTSAKIQADDTKMPVSPASRQNSASLLGKDKEKSIKILFFGDLMFDRYIREISAKKGNGFIFEKIKNMLFSDDLAVANLEGPITENNSLSIGTLPGEKNHLIFTFDKNLAKTLFDNNIKLVNIGNNHILNFGQNGLAETEKYLDGSGVEYFGDTGQAKTIIKNINGYKIGFVNYNQFACRDALQCVSTTIENIRNLREKSDIVVVYTHWGMEYETAVFQNLKNLGHEFIDSGADLVIGSHPHVIEPKEEYKSKEIYYSLGNFIFDQYFSPETKKGLAVEVSVYPDKKMEYKDIPLILDNNGQTRVSSL